MGLYLNQLPPTEVARLKAELAETLIANFCYPRFFDYRVNTLRMRPVDRMKRQEVWQYLNAVDFNVWGRVDVDSPDFQRQVERLFIHFVQRNRNFFGEQGRKRMVDVRSLITTCSVALADALRGHLLGKQESQPFGSPRPVYSWSTTNVTGSTEPVWEQVLNGTMQLQQQLQELRGEIRPVSAPLVAAPATTPQLPPSPSPRSTGVPSRRPRTGAPAVNGNGVREEHGGAWPQTGGRTGRTGELRRTASAPFPTPALPKEVEPTPVEFSASAPGGAEMAATLPLPLSPTESAPPAFQVSASTEVPSAPPVVPIAPAAPSTRSRRGRPSEPLSLTSPAEVSPVQTGPGSASQPLSAIASVSTPQVLQSVVSSTAPVDRAVRSAESSSVLMSDEDVVIFEQMRHQLVVWLRVEAVRSGIELGNQGAFQLIEVLRHQDDIDLARLQVVSTLLNMCEQIVTSGHATLFDYKQAMMFYLMHTRRAR